MNMPELGLSTSFRGKTAWDADYFNDARWGLGEVRLADVSVGYGGAAVLQDMTGDQQR